MFKKLKIAVIFFSSLIFFAATNWAQDFYKDVPAIKIKEPLGVMVGSLNPQSPIIDISIQDVSMYTGHICPGVASGFKATTLALDALYGKEMPVRGEIKISTNKPSDLLDVASYITGARAFYGRDEVNHNDIVIDTTLGKKPGIVIMIFKRKDTGKMVKVTFNKNKLFNPEMMKKMEQLKGKIMEGKATEEEKIMMRENLQKKVEQILFNLPEGVITVEEVKDYNFPKKD